MKIAIAGASGAVGRDLVPRLVAAGNELVLLGRDRNTLAELFPGSACGDLGSTDLLAGCDRLINLAAMNNDVEGDLDAFRGVNEGIALELARAAERAGVPEYVFVSSVHALDPANTGNYAVSKRLGHAALMDFASTARLNVVTVYLGAVTTATPRGRLAVLARLPRSLRRPLFDLASCLRPTTSPSDIWKCLGDPMLFAQDRESKIILTQGQSANASYMAVTRVTEVLVSAVAAPLAAIIALALIVAIRLDSAGPAIFAQKRIGQHRRTFVCYKFRTMRIHTPEAGTHDVSQSAVTRVGRVLRRTKLDELPQLINVLLGQMSFVGPRPCLPSQKELIAERSRRGVFASRPGITGLSQINGIDMSDPRKLAVWDAKYLALRTLPLDVRILVRTATGAGSGDRTSR